MPTQEPLRRYNLFSRRRRHTRWNCDWSSVVCSSDLALQSLLEQDTAQRNGTCWLVPDPILRCWLSTVLSPQRADARPAGSENRQRFEKHLRALWTHWMQTHQLSFPEQVVELFGRFADDTVSLDSKTGRLPKF